MRRLVQSASIATLALLAPGGILAATEDVAAPPVVVAPPATSETAPSPPAAAEQIKPATAEQTRPALPAEDLAVAEKLRDLVENKLNKHVAREQDRAGVQAFYSERGFAPLWIGRNAMLPRAKEAVAYLRTVDQDGLDPVDYPTPTMTDIDPERLAADELKLTNSVLAFARHARTGRVAFTRVSGSIYFDLQFPDAAEVLGGIAASGNIGETLAGYLPKHPAYKKLKAELAAGRRGGTAGPAAVRVPSGPTLRLGAEDARIPELRKRLKLAANDDEIYDEEIVAAVKQFQQQAGLNPDGFLGPNTLAKLNGESHSDPADSIIANMERWRWLPHDLGTTYVMVNVPDYTLKVVDRGETVWSTRIVVGKPGRYATPLLTETMKFITVNPTWNVPPSIIRNEYLPALARDPGALARVGLRIGHNRDGSLRIYQPPGERNALGRIRFNFPNRFLVYQHDTPDKHLFEKSARAYSHGCMRVQNPDQYAETLLSISQPEDGYTANRIRSLYGTGERGITFKKPIPVYITYQTTFVDDAGKLQTRPDIYGLDREITSLRHEERGVADIPIARNYNSGSKPVMADLPRSPRDDLYWSGYAGYGRGGYRPFGRFRPW
jgi:murein L,D-transpeptidase YcbB/YkuD